MRVRTLFLLTGLALAFNALAISDGIRKNRLDECAIWLCAPGGFGEGCDAARSAFIGRVTDYTGGKHPERKYTSIPGIQHCIDDDGTAQQNSTKMTYSESSLAYIPAHKECARIATIQKCSGNDNCRTLKKCVAWNNVPVKKVWNTRCYSGSYIYDDYGQIIGSQATPAFCTQTHNTISVYGDGQLYGSPYEWKD